MPNQNSEEIQPTPTLIPSPEQFFTPPECLKELNPTLSMHGYHNEHSSESSSTPSSSSVFSSSTMAWWMRIMEGLRVSQQMPDGPAQYQQEYMSQPAAPTSVEIEGRCRGIRGVTASPDLVIIDDVENIPAHDDHIDAMPEPLPSWLTDPPPALQDPIVEELEMELRRQREASEYYASFHVEDRSLSREAYDDFVSGKGTIRMQPGKMRTMRGRVLRDARIEFTLGAPVTYYNYSGDGTFGIVESIDPLKITYYHKDSNRKIIRSHMNNSTNSDWYMCDADGDNQYIIEGLQRSEEAYKLQLTEPFHKAFETTRPVMGLDAAAVIRLHMKMVSANPAISESEKGKYSYAPRGVAKWDFEKRTHTTFGRTCRKGLGITQEMLPDHLLDQWAAEMNTELFESYRYEVVDEDNLLDAYQRVESGRSCMRYDYCRDWLKVYSENPNNCKMLIVYTKGKENCRGLGRALLWIDDNGKKFMDRIYPSGNSEMIQAMRNWGKMYGYSHYIYKDKVETCITLNAPSSDKWPYADTFVYMKELEHDKVRLSTAYCVDGESYDNTLQETSGDHSNSGNNDHTCYCCADSFDEDDMRYIDSVDDYVCDTCVSENYFSCNDCETWHDNNDSVDHDDLSFCESCAKRILWDCEDCSETFNRYNNSPDRDELDNTCGNVCSSCAEDRNAEREEARLEEEREEKEYEKQQSNKMETLNV